ncbi:TetR/AcrR family transcriptional regulator [Gordonia sp. (in: high G+C Gram-positive bacteria)]|uniref:TetR/AcrR family transcriptional regulator n=1 Tax=Gordonia sp. (in: high G+C Gram-positive bacteria) TaxID=84139 RepID=UPI003C72F9B2
MSVPPAPSPTVDPLRARFLDAGLRVLANDGFGGFKQSTVCAETGLTTGGFYHSFKNWKDFETALIEHWQTEATANVVAQLRTIGSPVERLRALHDATLNLNHETERAIRTWSATDAMIAEAVVHVDETRRDAVTEFVTDVIGDAQMASLIAAQSLMVLIGYQCSGVSNEELSWSIDQIFNYTVSLPTAQASE